jgi:hypothetical protein
MLKEIDIETKIGCYDNVRELVDLIREMQKEATIFKACIANLIDHTHGTVGDAREGMTHRDRVIETLSREFQVSPEMAAIMIDATNETSENKAFDII